MQARKSIPILAILAALAAPAQAARITSPAIEIQASGVMVCTLSNLGDTGIPMQVPQAITASGAVLPVFTSCPTPFPTTLDPHHICTLTVGATPSIGATVRMELAFGGSAKKLRAFCVTRTATGIAEHSADMR